VIQSLGILQTIQPHPFADLVRNVRSLFFIISPRCRELISWPRMHRLGISNLVRNDSPRFSIRSESQGVLRGEPTRPRRRRRRGLPGTRRVDVLKLRRGRNLDGNGRIHYRKIILRYYEGLIPTPLFLLSIYGRDVTVHMPFSVPPSNSLFETPLSEVPLLYFRSVFSFFFLLYLYLFTPRCLYSSLSMFLFCFVASKVQSVV